MNTTTLPPGTVLYGRAHNYTIRKALGQGSFGITYLADVQLAGALGSLDTHIQVAIKEFFMKDVNGRAGTTVMSDTKDGLFNYYKGRFRHEAENLSKLHHAGIIKVLESFDANATVYFSMEYLGHGSLDDLIARKGRLAPVMTLNYARFLARALEYMHGARMLHLDLKPGNIMLGGIGRPVVLIDFGLAKKFNDDGQPDTTTSIGQGTRGYAPLEQSDYQPSPDGIFPATMDIYAFGATLFKMLTGHRPPDASEILNEGFPEDALTSINTPAPLIALIRRCMAPLHKKRYQSIAEVLELLNLMRVSDDDYTAPSPDEHHKQPAESSPTLPLAQPTRPPRDRFTPPHMPTGIIPLRPDTDRIDIDFFHLGFYYKAVITQKLVSVSVNGVTRRAKKYYLGPLMHLLYTYEYDPGAKSSLLPDTVFFSNLCIRVFSNNENYLALTKVKTPRHDEGNYLVDISDFDKKLRIICPEIFELQAQARAIADKSHDTAW